MSTFLPQVWKIQQNSRKESHQTLVIPFQGIKDKNKAQRQTEDTEYMYITTIHYCYKISHDFKKKEIQSK